MTDLDQPATRRDVEATRRDVEAVRHDSEATRRDVEALRRDSEGMRHDLDALRGEMNARFAQVDIRFDQVDARFDRMEARFEALFEQQRLRVEILTESFRSEFHNLFDWVHATTTGVGARVDRLESHHGERLLNLETRVTRLEKPRKQPPR